MQWHLVCVVLNLPQMIDFEALDPYLQLNPVVVIYDHSAQM